MTQRPDLKFSDWVQAALAIAVLLPWISVQWERSVNGNVAWLALCAQRWMGGMKMSEGCYDTNPPLSMLLYTPPAMLHARAGLEFHYAIYAMVFGLIAFGIMTVWSTIKNDDALELMEKRLLLFSYVLSVTLASALAFADKDHIIAILLLPLVLVQRTIGTEKKIAPIVKYPALALGALAVLIKPHFGVIPLGMIMLRLIKSRTLKSLIAADFLMLAALTLIYAGALVTLFTDFLEIMLPDILRYYLPYNNPVKTWTDAKLLAPLALLSLAVGLCSTMKTPGKRRLLLLLNLGAAATLGIYIFQMKGLTYQLLPFYTFLIPALTVGIHAAFVKKIEREKWKNALTLTLMIICVATVYLRYPLRPGYPSHDDYKNAELTRYIGANCGMPCAYLVTHENMEIVSQTAFYLGGSYATRFPGYWYIALLEDTPFPGPANQRETNEPLRTAADRRRFADYTAQDLARFKPEIILVLTTPSEYSDRPAFDYFDYFSQNPAFADETRKYEKTGAFETDRAFYFRDTRYDYAHILSWDVYKRTDTGQDDENAQDINGQPP